MFDGSSIRGFQAIHESDMKLIPDPATAFVDPFRAKKTLVINFSIRDPFTDEPYSRDPRNIAAKAEEYLKSTGIADTVYFGAEAEFYVFDDVRFETNQHDRYYYIDSIEGAWNTGREEEGGNLGYKTPYKGGYFPVPPVDHFADLRDEMVNKLLQVGLQVERSHHEVGTAGQAEINYKFSTLPHAADELMLFKYIIKNVAWKNGKYRDLHAQAALRRQRLGHALPPVASGRTASPLFYDESGYGGLSDIARWYIGGLLAPRAVAAGLHQPDGQLLPPPGARLRGSGQPRLLAAQPLGLHPHPDHRQPPKAKRIEFRVPDPSSNPYLAFAAHADGRPRRHQEQDRAARARSTRTSTSCRRTSTPPSRRCRARSPRCSTASRRTTSTCSRAACSRPTSSRPGSTASAPTRCCRSSCGRTRTSSSMYYDI